MITTEIKSLSNIAPGRARSHIGRGLRTTHYHPLYYRMITKCGCTYILNLLYYLQFEFTNLNPIEIHDRICLIPTAFDATDEEIANSPYSFVIVRDPIKRFMSLYFDKLYGPRLPHKTHSLGDFFKENGLVETNINNDIGKHRENCIRSINWIKKNIRGETDQDVNWHWKPQYIRLNQVHAYQFNVLTLEDVNYQLELILKPIVPRIKEAMTAVAAQNISKKPVTANDVLDDELSELINDTYSYDREIYDEVSKFWTNYKVGHV